MTLVGYGWGNRYLACGLADGYDRRQIGSLGRFVEGGIRAAECPNAESLRCRKPKYVIDLPFWRRPGLLGANVSRGHACLAITHMET